MGKHTDLPWTISQYGDFFDGAFLVNEADIQDEVDDGTITNDEAKEIYRANAAFMELACNSHADLLAALGKMEKWLSGYGTASPSDMREVVRAAIAAAES